MLDIYPFILETIVLIRPLAEQIYRADSDLGRQLHRAQSSIALNVAEGCSAVAATKRRVFTLRWGQRVKLWRAWRLPLRWGR
ncbi:MAG: hypothetical protein H6718_34560 [Polyangiaceae bacterium]|nr:hypothetical protein [Myxococcales bacterium]MCB9590583.1 hypothetical protein [Polyangiaceae bacterium]MCB9608872.1 hypothetical protein [Polyangiaceae bacterium]